MIRKRTAAAIVIVNWNCWEDVARCISACGHLRDFTGSLIVVDNGSTDSSVDMLQEWGAGNLEIPSTSTVEEIQRLEKKAESPLQFAGLFKEQSLSCAIESVGLASRTWYLVQSEKNSGFGAGNNVGLRIAMLDPDCVAFWCLNADAIPRPDSWAALAKFCESEIKPIVSGSVLLNYDRADTIQTIGSEFSRHTLLVSYKNVNEPVATLNGMPEKQSVGYPIGASLLINRPFIEKHGYFDERFFLYYEEPDLVIRLENSANSFVCTRSQVYHKGGQTTGGGKGLMDRGLRADYEYNRSRMILAKKIGGLTVLLAGLAAMISMLKRLCVGRVDLAKRVLPACVDGWLCE